MIPALALILCFQLFGELVSHGLRLPLPGPVIGLTALIAAGMFRPAIIDFLRPAARGLLSNLSLFFVPAGVGIVSHLGLFSQNALGIVAALTISTILAIAVGAVTFSVVARVLGNTADD